MKTTKFGVIIVLFNSFITSIFGEQYKSLNTKERVEFERITMFRDILHFFIFL